MKLMVRSRSTVSVLVFDRPGRRLSFIRILAHRPIERAGLSRCGPYSIRLASTWRRGRSQGQLLPHGGSALRLALEQKGLHALLDHLAPLVEDGELALHHAALRVRRLAGLQDLDAGPDRVAGLDRLGELEAVETEERDQRVVVEVELKQDRKSVV